MKSRKQTPQIESKPVRTCLYLDDKLIEAAKSRCATEKRSFSNYVRRLIEKDTAPAK